MTISRIERIQNSYVDFIHKCDLHDRLTVGHGGV
jgi:hypothetical protein